jgi:carboxymethylenebutenolidase
LTIITETRSYEAADGTKVPVFMASPAGAGPFPALLMAYELWGMLEIPGGGPHMRDVAARFAAAGYVAAVPDYYAARGQQPRMEGGTIKGGPSDEQSISDLCDGVRFLAALPSVDGGRIGAIGWCGGGRQSLFLAARCPGIRAAAAFYGRPINRPTQTGPSPIGLVPEMHCPVFGAFGEDDHAIPAETARQLDAELTRCGVTHEIHIYPGTGHAFMNDQRDGYFEPAATDSWNRVLAFFARHLTTARAA